MRLLAQAINNISEFVGIWAFAVLLVISILTILFESLGIVAFFPFLEILENADVLNHSENKTFAFNFINYCLDAINAEVSLQSVSLLLITLFFLKGLMLFTSYSVRAVVSSRLLKEIRACIYSDLQKSNYQVFQRKGSGHFSNLMIEQSNKVVMSFQFIVQFIAQIINATGLFIFALILDVKIAIAFVLSMFIISLIFKKINSIVRKISVQTAVKSSILSGIIVQVFAGFKYLKATQSFRYFDKSFLKSINELSLLYTKNGVASGFTNALKEPLAIILVVSLLAIIKVYFGMSPENLLVSIALFYKCISNALMAQRQWQNFVENSGSATLVFNEIHELKNHIERPDGINNLSNISKITFENISIKYDKSSTYALQGINFEIQKNKITAILGPSGSGKSTLASLLTFLIEPSVGQLKFDDICSTQISKLNLRKYIGYVTQDPVLFEGSIITNLMSKHPSEISELNYVECWSILDKVGLNAFVIDLPKKLDTHITEGGRNLSGGQKQRLALARELLKKPQLLILDEATSALDLKAEQKFVKLISEVKTEMTVIMIAHRLTSVKEVDEIIYLEFGEIVEVGNPRQLMKKTNSRFFKISKVA